MVYTAGEWAARVKSAGIAARKTTVTYFMPIEGNVTVRTEEGDILVEQDGFLASDGERVWPVSREYFHKNYERVND